MISFIIGLITGSFIGIMIMCALISNKGEWIMSEESFVDKVIAQWFAKRMEQEYERTEEYHKLMEINNKENRRKEEWLLIKPKEN